MLYHWLKSSSVYYQQERDLKIKTDQMRSIFHYFALCGTTQDNIQWQIIIESLGGDNAFKVNLSFASHQLLNADEP